MNYDQQEYYVEKSIGFSASGFGASSAKVDVISGPRIKLIQHHHLGMALHTALRSHNRIGIKQIQDQSLMALPEGGISRIQFLDIEYIRNKYNYA